MRGTKCFDLSGPTVHSLYCGIALTIQGQNSLRGQLTCFFTKWFRAVNFKTLSHTYYRLRYHKFNL